MKIYVPLDSAAVSLGADAVADAIVAEAAARKIDVQVIRNGSRGMVWLEPLVEIETDQGRVGFSNVDASQAGALLDGKLSSLGNVEDIPFFARQTRLTFARCGVIDPLIDLTDYQAHGGLTGLRRAAADGPKMTSWTKSPHLGFAVAAGQGFRQASNGKPCRTQADQKYIVCNADEGDSGTLPIV